jgi:hypothetical protein
MEATATSVHLKIEVSTLLGPQLHVERDESKSDMEPLSLPKNVMLCNAESSGNQP